MKPSALSSRRTGLCPMVAALLLIMTAGPLWADVCFIHDYTTEDLFLGTKTAQLKMAYTPAAMVVEKQTRFTGEWMTRFFGEVKEERVATHFLMDQDQIREIDWQNRRIFVFDLDRLGNIGWVRQRVEVHEAAAEHLSARYTVKAPALEIRIAPQPETIDGYTCRRVDARLRLETVDRLKGASSITLVDQTLWLSHDVPGYRAYDAFRHQLAARLGIEAERLGPLTFLLRYWNGPLTPISDTLRQLDDGYTVRSHLVVTARYVSGIDTATPKTIDKTIKQETVRLREVSDAPVDLATLTEPEGFEIVRPD